MPHTVQPANGQPLPSYDADVRLAEFYDQTQNQTRDLGLIRKLLSGGPPLRVLEAFCGTGRIMLPLATDGHDIVGMDLSPRMLDRAAAKLAAMDPQMQQRVRFICADCTQGPWPGGFDVVLLAGNCLYELATPQQQANCIRLASAALKEGGHLLLDNDHMEGQLAESWCQAGVSSSYPSGTCPDGTKLEGRSEVIWYDRPARLWRARRSITIRFPDGRVVSREWIQQKHPPSIGEMRTWMAEAGFEVQTALGSYEGSALTQTSGRAIFWARKR